MACRTIRNRARRPTTLGLYPSPSQRAGQSGADVWLAQCATGQCRGPSSTTGADTAVACLPRPLRRLAAHRSGRDSVGMVSSAAPGPGLLWYRALLRVEDPRLRRKPIVGLSPSPLPIADAVESRRRPGGRGHRGLSALTPRGSREERVRRPDVLFVLRTTTRDRLLQQSDS